LILKKFLLICLVPLLLGQTAMAAERPITLAGVNVGMTRKEVITRLEKRGYSCRAENIGSDSPCEVIKDDCKASCIKGSAKIKLSTGAHETTPDILFSCEVFDVCGYDPFQLVDSLSANGIRLLTLKNEDGADPYCGLGPARDKLCIKHSSGIGLFRYYHGKPRPSFK
jgi:hypothetical protein